MTKLLLAAVALFPATLFAVDGAVLINQSTVTAAGGFPYTISQPGSYKLSGNLQATINVSGIIVTASHVTLDLNGFSISVSTNMFAPNVAGIKSSGPITGLTIRNGSVVAGVSPLDLSSTTGGTVVDGVTLISPSGGGQAFLGGSIIVRQLIFPTGEVDVSCQSLVVDSVAGFFHRTTAPSGSCTYVFGFVNGAVL
jgi:hypothetical protein